MKKPTADDSFDDLIVAFLNAAAYRRSVVVLLGTTCRSPSNKVDFSAAKAKNNEKKVSFSYYYILFYVCDEMIDYVPLSLLLSYS